MNDTKELAEAIGGPQDGALLYVGTAQNTAGFAQGHYARVPRRHPNSPTRFAWHTLDKKYVLPRP